MLADVGNITVGGTGKSKRQIGGETKVRFAELRQIMGDADRAALQKHA